MFTHYLAFLGCWILGVIILFLILKNSNHSLKPGDILFTLILSVALSIVFSFAAEKANLFHWATCIAFSFLGGFVTYKFLDKQYQPKKMFAINPMIAIPLLNIFNSGGLWVLVCLPLIGFFIAIYKAFKASKSGSWVTKPNGDRVSSNKNVPIYKTGQFYWALCWLAAFGILLWWIIVDYKGV